MRFEFNDDNHKICSSANINNYGIQCDICGNKFQSVSNINGRRYCAGCYYKTFMKDNQKAEIDQLKQQLEEYKNKENTSAVNSWDEMLKNCESCGLNECIGCEYTQTCVQNIKQQLTEKQKTIDEINKEFVQAVHDWKALCAKKDKNFQEYRNEVVSNIEKEVYERMRDTVKEYEMQLAEKDKEIEEKMMSFEKRCQEYYKSDEFKRDFAIQELEKVKTLIQNAINFEKPNFVEVYDAINKQIKELKGEKDVTS